MTALTERHDAQTMLNRPSRPRTLADAGALITAEHDAMRDLLRVVEDECRWRGGSENLRAAANRVLEVRG
jgi:hypothetical protein